MTYNYNPLEITGVGCHKYAIKKALELSKDTVNIILCKTRNYNLLLKRITAKTFNYTSPLNIDITEHSKFVEKDLNEDLKTKFWNCSTFNFFEIFMDTSEDININVKRLSNYLK